VLRITRLRRDPRLGPESARSWFRHDRNSRSQHQAAAAARHQACVFVFNAHPTLLADPRAYAGQALYGSGKGGHFDPLLFGAALTVGIALIAQTGEQVDCLRFMPKKTPARRGRWWAVRAGRPSGGRYLFIQPMDVGSQVAMAGNTSTMTTAASWM
jgi:hypothetical protein